MEPGQSSAQFDAYLANLSRLKAMEVAGCEGHITKDEI